ncbi:chaperonin GroEL [Candidatus Xenohaliotis californiensis]|uniref:Chaperonin GroEL n=1 Tax=Candidatus Xenohaliotis californiensis TaxID=84677 RepID=A0ABP0EU68_9RICK|nr:chaperonin GroEL [Candidatus Xenohaliotis californiensis]
MANIVVMGSEARISIKAGLDCVVNAAGATLGPMGRTVAIGTSWGDTKFTKDGVTVVKSITLPDPIENIGAQLVKQAAKKTDDSVGDGTTTCSVLLQAMIADSFKHIAAGSNPMSLSRGMHKAAEAIDKEILAIVKDIRSKEETAQVATISANGDKLIGKIISEAIETVGKDGVITVEEGKGLNALELDVVQGMSFDRGYLSPYFITNTEKSIAELENAYILILDKKLSSLQQILPLLEAIVQSGKPLLIIAEDVEGEALATLVINRLRAQLKVAAVKAPGFGERRKEMLHDIAHVTGAHVVSDDSGIKMESVTLEMLGRAKKIKITQDSTTIIDGEGEKASVEARANQIRNLVNQATSDYDKEKLQERLAKLAGGVAVIRVGGATEIEVKERKDRVDDALNATRAAVEEGIVPGGGSALFYIAERISKIKGEDEDEENGVKIIRRALVSPLQRIINNSGLNGSVIATKLQEKQDKELIYDSRNFRYVNAYEAGIIDPAKVVRAAVRGAISTASIIITVESVVAEKPENKTNSQGHGHGHGGAGDMGDMGGMGGMGGMGF